MIYLVTTERYSTTIRRHLRAFPAMRLHLASLTYEEIFFERAGPIGHYIFTDFDRLTRYELECAARLAHAIEAAAPDARIFNHPLRALERFPLLVALHKAGINDFEAIRIDGGARPTRYPVFIRAEDGYGAPETDLIADDAAFDSALEDLRARCLPLKGRVAIGYAAERSPDGYFRKYAAFNVAGTIIAYHLMLGDRWVVKRRAPNQAWIHTVQREEREQPATVAEEAAYVRENPHREAVARAFAVAGIEYGRVDYGVVGGRIQVYEINTNPSLPSNAKQVARAERADLTRGQLTSALSAIDTPLAARGRVRFIEDAPRPQNRHWPRRKLAVSLMRCVLDKITPPRTDGPSVPEQRREGPADDLPLDRKVENQRQQSHLNDSKDQRGDDRRPQTQA
jgi:hypothetical protein